MILYIATKYIHTGSPLANQALLHACAIELEGVIGWRFLEDLSKIDEDRSTEDV